jgi:hypothetical protein
VLGDLERTLGTARRFREARDTETLRKQPKKENYSKTLHVECPAAACSPLITSLLLFLRACFPSSIATREEKLSTCSNLGGKSGGKSD